MRIVFFDIVAQLSSMINKRNGFVLLFAGALGLFASVKLIIEKIAVLSNTNYIPSCDINPVLSCGSVINTEQAALFGFPNPIVGVAGFAVVITLSVLMLFKVSLPSWVFIGLNIGALFGLLFMIYLIFQSLYVINALCPWCMVVWACLFVIVWQVTLYNFYNDFLKSPKSLTSVVVALDWIILAVMFLTVATLIFFNWMDFWLGV